MLRDGQAHHQGQSFGDGLERGSQPALREHDGVQPVGEVTQLGQGLVQLGSGGADGLGSCRVVGLALDCREPHADGEQPLLGAVVQVAFELAALLEARVQQPRTGRLNF